MGASTAAPGSTERPCIVGDTNVVNRRERDDSRPPQTAEPTLLVEILPPRLDVVLKTQDLFQAKVMQVEELVDQTTSRDKSVRELEILLPEGLSYSVGDRLSVLEDNTAYAVYKVLKRFSLTKDSLVIVRGESAAYHHLPLQEIIPAGILLAKFVDLAQTATRHQVLRLSELAESAADRNGLKTLAEDEGAYAQHILARGQTLTGLLDEFQTVHPDFATFIQMLPAMTPKSYCISSSPARTAQRCTIVFAGEKALAARQGPAAAKIAPYLPSLKAGDSLTFRIEREQSLFRLPDNPQQPLIMVATGVGIAPFRAFLEERSALRKRGLNLGPALLFAGFQHPDWDYLYRDDLLAFQSMGLVKIHAAFAQATQGARGSVEDSIAAQESDIKSLIASEAAVFICTERPATAAHLRVFFARAIADAGKGSASALAARLAHLDKAIRCVEQGVPEESEETRPLTRQLATAS